ncbi:hypothetical protein [Rhodopseudomonas parapalustris]
MELVRLGKSPFQRTDDNVSTDKQSGLVKVIFRGQSNTSDYRIDISWDDLEKLVVEFAAMGESKAKFLLHAKNLAVHARRAGWNPS